MSPSSTCDRADCPLVSTPARQWTLRGTIRKPALVEGDYRLGLFVNSSDFAGDVFDLVELTVHARGRRGHSRRIGAAHRGFVELDVARPRLSRDDAQADGSSTCFTTSCPGLRRTHSRTTATHGAFPDRRVRSFARSASSGALRTRHHRSAGAGWRGRGTTVFDVGANIGLMAIPVLRAARPAAWCRSSRRRTRCRICRRPRADATLSQIAGPCVGEGAVGERPASSISSIGRRSATRCSKASQRRSHRRRRVDQGAGDDAR